MPQRLGELAGAVLALTIGSGCHAAFAPVKPIAALKFEKPLADQPASVDATLTFLSEGTLALRLCTPYDWRTRAHTCQLQVATLSGGGLWMTAETETPKKPTWSQDVLAMANGAILLTYSSVQYLYSADLKNTREIPITNLVVPSAPGNVVGEGMGGLAPPKNRGCFIV